MRLIFETGLINFDLDLAAFNIKVPPPGLFFTLTAQGALLQFWGKKKVFEKKLWKNVLKRTVWASVLITARCITVGVMCTFSIYFDLLYSCAKGSNTVTLSWFALFTFSNMTPIIILNCWKFSCQYFCTFYCHSATDILGSIK